MTNEEIKKMIFAILGEADYDLAKSLDPKAAEEPEEAEERMKGLIRIARKYIG